MCVADLGENVHPPPNWDSYHRHHAYHANALLTELPRLLVHKNGHQKDLKLLLVQLKFPLSPMKFESKVVFVFPSLLVTVHADFFHGFSAPRNFKMH